MRARESLVVYVIAALDQMEGGGDMSAGAYEREARALRQAADVLELRAVHRRLWELAGAPPSPERLRHAL